MTAPLARPVKDWPLILCGPILRRVTSKSVSVFMALSSQCKIVLEIYKNPSPGTFDTPKQSQPHYTVALGKNLHVCIAEWNSSTPLEAQILYGYDLLLTEIESQSTKRLGDLEPNLLNGPYKLGYEYRLPSFCLPPGLKDLNIFHGSCRKPHAPGSDALALLDDLIKKDHQNPLKRPHQLLLTGDQIYADDVALPLLVTLRESAKDLLSWGSEERISRKQNVSISFSDSQVLPGPLRGAFINNNTTFTGGVKDPRLVDGHLIFLGEFYAMYLMAWSDELWPRTENAPTLYTLPTIEDLRDYLKDGLQLVDAEKYLERIRDSRLAALNFVSSLPKVRRALANIPTYMMFDDHEVTDDWYLHRKWVTDIKNNPPGRQVIRNALAAYAVFQDWGNHPENYAPKTLGRDLLEKLTYNFDSKLVPIESQSEALDTLLDLNVERTQEDQRMHWDWVYAERDADYQIVALDTRTWRGFPTAERGDAALIESNSSKSDDQLIAEKIPLGLQLVSRKPTDDRLTIIISPAPVIGHPIVEFAQKAAIYYLEQTPSQLKEQLDWNQKYLEFLKKRHDSIVDLESSTILERIIKEVEKAIKIAEKKQTKLEASFSTASQEAKIARENNDSEAWSANREAFEDLLNRLAHFKRTIILSGDVHYAFSNQVAYFRTNQATVESSRIIQFVSSALKNEGDNNRRLADLNYDYVPTMIGWLGFDRDLTKLRNEVKSALDTGILTNKDVDPALAKTIANLYFLFEMNDRFSKPAVIPNGRYMTEQAFELIRDTARDPETLRDLTQWRYSIKYLIDNRSQSVRELDWNKLGAILNKSSDYKHHDRMLIGTTRAIVGVNNIGQIQFNSLGNTTTINQVVHRLHWQILLGSEALMNQSKKQQVIILYTEHNASLDLPTLDEFPEVTA